MAKPMSAPPPTKPRPSELTAAAEQVSATGRLEVEVPTLGSDEVGEKELKETKDEIIRAFPARFATANQVAAQMAALAVYDLPDKELQTFTARIASVTAADVRRTAQKYLRPDNLVIVVVGDRTSIEASLRRIGEVELRDLDGAPIK